MNQNWKKQPKSSCIFFKKVKDSSLILDNFSYRWILLKSRKNQLLVNNGQKLIFSKMCFNVIRKILRKLRKDSCIIQMKKKRWKHCSVFIFSFARYFCEIQWNLQFGSFPRKKENSFHQIEKTFANSKLNAKF